MTATITPTFTVSNTFTASPTAVPGFAFGQTAADLPIAASVPHRGEDLCVAFPQPVASSTLIFYNGDGEKVADLTTGGGGNPCLKTDAIAPGIYYVKVQATLSDGSAVEKFIRVAILP
jgi:hypothetical protein